MLAELIKDLPAAPHISGDPEVAVSGIRCDSRLVGPGDTFVAIRGGEEVDRHRFVPQALQRGAAAVVVEEPTAAADAVVVQVEDCRAALAAMAARYYGHPARRMRLAGVTGTNGKTTTAYLLRELLRTAGFEAGYIGTLGHALGEQLHKGDNTTPEADRLHAILAQMVAGGCREAVLEVSSHALALQRVAGLQFAVGVFTNLTRDHLDFHGDEAAYMAAKARLFEQLAPGGTAVVNIDDAAGRQLVSGLDAPALAYGFGEAADVRVQDVQMGPHGMSMRLRLPVGEATVDSRLTGKFNCHNLLAAIASGLALGLDWEAIKEGVGAFTSVPGRFERVALGGDFEVIVDYAHTPDALDNVLRAARPLASGRLACVFGCGGDRDRGKRPQMGRVAEILADRVYLTSDNPRGEDPEAILAEIAAGMAEPRRARLLADRREAIFAAVQEAAPGDVVVVAGKGHEAEQVFADRTVPFDDRQTVKDALAARYGRPHGVE